MPDAPHPYKLQPDYAFWTKAVSNVDPRLLNPAVNFPFRISREDRVATAGSCFAQHIARNLAQRGFNYFITETAHPMAAGVDGLGGRFGYGLFSARFGNVYTSRQLVQLFDRAFGRFAPEEDAWKDGDGRWYDPFRPGVEPGGFRTEDEMRADRDQHLAAVRHMFEDLDVFVFTLGLTEGWQAVADGAVFPLCPGVRAGVFDAGRHRFFNQTVAEVTEDLTGFIRALSEVNDDFRVIFTVSPVPLMATAEDRHVLVSTVASKAILRAAADQVERAHANVGYFPSFEIVTSSASAERYFATDRRSVTEDAVNHVMSVFFEAVADLGSEDRTRLAPEDEGADFFSRVGEVVQVICDEEALGRT